jgi:hypothetical protein
LLGQSTMLRDFILFSSVFRGLKIQETLSITWMCQLQIQSIIVLLGSYTMHVSNWLPTLIHFPEMLVTSYKHTLCNILNSEYLSYTMVEAWNLTSALYTKCLTKHN